MWDAIIAKMPGDSVLLPDQAPENLKALLSSNWLFGYAPEMAGAGPTPNGFGMWKLLCAGEVAHYCFPLSGLIPAMRTMHSKDAFGFSEVEDLVKKFTQNDFKKLQELGCECSYVKQKAGEAFFIPSGFLHAEVCTSGVLVYGSRRTVLTISDTSSNNYEALIGCYSKEGHDIKRYQQCLDLMKPGMM
jgi:hypothetical protein